MSVHPRSPRRSGSADVSRKLFLAQKAMTLATWRFFKGTGMYRTRDELSIMPRLFFELYLAHKAGENRAMTGPRYIARPVERGLVTIEDRPPEDLRKDFVLPTDRLITLVEAEFHQAARLFAHLMSPPSRRRR
jgi:hypothetical protein